MQVELAHGNPEFSADKSHFKIVAEQKFAAITRIDKYKSLKPDSEIQELVRTAVVHGVVTELNTKMEIATFILALPDLTYNGEGFGEIVNM